MAQEYLALYPPGADCAAMIFAGLIPGLRIYVGQEINHRWAMETYIIRVYRRSAGSPEEITGISEHVESGKKRRFKTVQQLCAIILDADSKNKGQKIDPVNNHP